MANGIELAKAYVQIVPSTEGIGGKLKQALNDSGFDGEGTKQGNKFVSAFGNAAKGVGKAAGTAIIAGGTAIAAGITGVVAGAVNAYKEYEQLQGGIETMFEDLSWDVGENAKKAFQTAGLSTNQYYETVMGFSASLNQSLIASEGNIARAAEIADRTVIDMSDNANKMGTSMESIQNAYAGFAKGNYTMLDNLKLGYGGTKQEMERLLEDATKLSGIEYNIDSFADITEAIHVIQTDLGITGTTAEEALSTIEGSMNSLKAAWANLLVGMADGNQNIGELVGNLMESINAVISNIAPRIQEALPRVVEGLNTLITNLLPMIPPLVAELLPPIITGVKSIFESIVNATPELINTISEITPMLIEALEVMAVALLASTPSFITSGMELIITLITSFVATLPTLMPQITDCIIQIAMALTEPNMLSQLLDAGIQLIVALLEGIIQALPQIISYLPQMIGNIASTLLNNLPTIIQAGVSLIGGLLKGVLQAVPSLLGGVANMGANVLNAIKNAFLGIFDIGRNLVSGLWEGIQSAWSWVKDGVSNLAGGLLSGVKSILGIASPSKRFIEIGKFVDEGFANGIAQNMGVVNRAMDGIVDATTGAIDTDIGFNANRSVTYDYKSSEQYGILELLNRYLPLLANPTPVVLDTGVMVSEMATPMRERFDLMSWRDGKR